jgi:phage shock protein PspC (stress-responsive transcriptional regulator)
MSSPYYPPQPPKRLLRSTSNRVVGGVCGGLADYLNMDANLVRILTVLISLFTGIPVILYIVALFVLPEGDTVPTAPPPVTGTSAYSGPFSAPQTSTPPPAYAPYPGAGAGPAAADAVWGREGAPWEQPQPQGTSPVPPAPSDPEAPVVPPQQDGPRPA